MQEHCLLASVHVNEACAREVPSWLNWLPVCLPVFYKKANSFRTAVDNENKPAGVHIVNIC